MKCYKVVEQMESGSVYVGVFDEETKKRIGYNFYSFGFLPGWQERNLKKAHAWADAYMENVEKHCGEFH